MTRVGSRVWSRTNFASISRPGSAFGCRDWIERLSQSTETSGIVWMMKWLRVSNGWVSVVEVVKWNTCESTFGRRSEDSAAEKTQTGTLRNAESRFRLHQLTRGILWTALQSKASTQKELTPASVQLPAMLRQILFNSTHTANYDLTLMSQSSTNPPTSLNTSHSAPINVAALLRPTTARGGGGIRDGELHKPDLITYIVMCLLLLLLVLLIVFFINCQLRNSFFASMPYDRSLREARTSYK